MLLLYMYKIQHQNSPELNKSSLTMYVMFVIVLYVISFQLLESNFPLCSLCLCLYVFCKFIHEKFDTVMIKTNGALLYDKLHCIYVQAGKAGIKLLMYIVKFLFLENNDRQKKFKKKSHQPIAEG